MIQYLLVLYDIKWTKTVLYTPFCSLQTANCPKPFYIVYNKEKLNPFLKKNQYHLKGLMSCTNISVSNLYKSRYGKCHVFIAEIGLYIKETHY